MMPQRDDKWKSVMIFSRLVCQFLLTLYTMIQCHLLVCWSVSVLHGGGPCQNYWLPCCQHFVGHWTEIVMEEGTFLYLVTYLFVNLANVLDHYPDKRPKDDQLSVFFGKIWIEIAHWTIVQFGPQMVHLDLWSIWLYGVVLFVGKTTPLYGGYGVVLFVQHGTLA